LRTVDDLQKLAAALFNLHMPPEHVMQSAADIIVAINRINPSGDLLPFTLTCPAAPDYVMALAAAAAVAEVQDKGGRINVAFRNNAWQWLLGFDQLPDNLKQTVTQLMEAAWRDGGSSLPPHILGMASLLPLKTFSEINKDFQSMIPKRFTKPYD
jgi:hypothetical protein